MKFCNEFFFLIIRSFLYIDQKWGIMFEALVQACWHIQTSYVCRKDSCQILLHNRTILLSKEMDSATIEEANKDVTVVIVNTGWNIAGNVPSFITVTGYQSLRLPGLFLHKSHSPIRGVQLCMYLDGHAILESNYIVASHSPLLQPPLWQHVWWITLWCAYEHSQLY